MEFGVANSKRSLEAQTALLEFILPFEIIDFTYNAASFYGKIRKELKDKGQPISDMDMLIASVAMANELIVVTNNENEFSNRHVGDQATAHIGRAAKAPTRQSTATSGK